MDKFAEISTVKYHITKTNLVRKLDWSKPGKSVIIEELDEKIYGGLSMIAFWNSKTVYIGFDLRKASAVRDQLDAAGIKYKYKVRSRAGERGGNRSRIGSPGMVDQMYVYEILVHEKDFERVHVCNK